MVRRRETFFWCRWSFFSYSGLFFVRKFFVRAAEIKELFKSEGGCTEQN